MPRRTATLEVVALLLSGGLAKQPCPSPLPAGAARPAAVLLAYTWGSGPSSCSPYFMRSWVALPAEARARTDLVILWEGSDQPCANEPAGGGARYVKMPDDVLAHLKATRLNAAAYRMRAVTWWLGLPGHSHYSYVGVLDTDMFFQSDIFDVLHRFIRGEHELHLVAENAAERNAAYTTRRLRGTASCERALTPYLLNSSVVRVPSSHEQNTTSERASYGSGRGRTPDRAPPQGRRLRHRGAHSSGATASARGSSGSPTSAPEVSQFWASFGETQRLNFGSMFGTRTAMIALCDAVVDVLIGPMAACWDQGMLNVLVWTGLIGSRLPGIHVTVWDCLHGPVKTLDVGGIRDSNGRYFNERGAPYAIVHQFRPTRHSGFVAELAKLLPPRAEPSGAGDARYHREAWKQALYPQRFQRVKFVWDDRRRMAKLIAMQNASGVPDPSDSGTDLPSPLPSCASAAPTRNLPYAASARHAPGGGVHGGAWEAMAQAGFVHQGFAGTASAGGHDVDHDRADRATMVMPLPQLVN